MLRYYFLIDVIQDTNDLEIEVFRQCRKSRRGKKRGVIKSSCVWWIDQFEPCNGCERTLTGIHVSIGKPLGPFPRYDGKARVVFRLYMFV